MKRTKKLHLSDVIHSVFYTIGFIAALCCLISCTSSKPVNACNVSNPEYLHGYTLDIPEELTQISDTVLMKVYKSGNNIVVEFDNN